MYQTYRDIAEFRLVYIREAHAADSDWPMEIAEEKGINSHKDFGQRCTTAAMLMKDKALTIPCLIDSMDDSTNKAYAAWPDKIFVIRTDGKVAVASSQGPFGFKPGLDKSREWLENFRQSGHEPPPIQTSDPKESPPKAPDRSK